VVVQAWPSTIRGVFGDQERYEQTYFAPYKGYYFSGDGARRDGVLIPSNPSVLSLRKAASFSPHAQLRLCQTLQFVRPRVSEAQQLADVCTCHAADGYYWITGRVDDVINVSGHRIGTAEVESALVLNEKCAEAAVVGYEHPIKGQGIYAFVTLMDGVEFNADVQKELIQCVHFEFECSVL
jgi:acetyl-CoA synthetase